MRGAVVKVTAGQFAGRDYEIEGYWKDIYGKSWMDSDGNLAAMDYAIRSGTEGLPLDNRVLYGKIGGAGKLMHVSQLDMSGVDEVTKDEYNPRDIAILGGDPSE